MTLNIALKEWHLAIGTLMEGSMSVLLRKGGILEAENQFVLEHPRFLFYPTFVHQDPRMVKEPWRGRIQRLPAEPETVEIRGWGEVARIFEVPSRAGLEALGNLHIWDVPMLDMRFNYRPEKPLYLVVVRAFRLAAPVTIANTLEYAGCKSWVPLRKEIDLAGSTQAVPEEQLSNIISRIETRFAEG